MKTTKCRACDATIFFIKTKASKAAPLDAKPQKRWIEYGDDLWGLVDTYESHFSTCPEAAAFRKKTKVDCDE